MRKVGIQDFDPIECYIRILKKGNLNCARLSDEEKEILNSVFLDELIKAISNEKGKDLVPYLSDIKAIHLVKVLSLKFAQKMYVLDLNLNLRSLFQVFNAFISYFKRYTSK